MSAAGLSASESVRTALAVLLLGALASVGCGLTGGGSPSREAGFYANRYYPIPEAFELPAGTSGQVILAGAHCRAKGPERLGTDEISGCFFVDLDRPELTRWTEPPASSAERTDLVAATFGDRGQLQVFEDGTRQVTPGLSADMEKVLASSFHSGPSPDGQWYAYSPYDASTPPKELYVRRFDGTGERKIAGPLENKIYGVAWSPDGKHLALDCAEAVDWDSTGGKGDRYNLLFTIDADGKNMTRIYRDAEPSVTVYAFLQYLPDGKSVVFAFGGTVLQVDLASRQVKTLFRAPVDGIVENLTRSPDGSKYAFVQDGLYTCRPDGSAPTRVTADPDVLVSSFVWAPDGERVVFKAHRRNEDCVSGVNWSSNSAWAMCNEGLFVASADGSNLRTLSDKHVAPDLVGVYVPGKQSVAR